MNAADLHPAPEALLRVRGLTKHYGTNVALNRVDLDILPGRVHVLFGENGSGKSTFISMLAGANQPTEGRVEIGGHAGAFRSVADARSHGIRAVFQEFSLVPQLTVAENIVLGEEPASTLGVLSKAEATQSARALISDLGFDLAPGIVARTLAPAHIIAVASPTYMAQRTPPTDPAGLSQFDGIVMRSLRTGRVRHWAMRDTAGDEIMAQLRETIVVNDPAAMREAAKLGLGVAMLTVPDVLPDLENGTLVRLLPHWYSDAGAISLYYASRTLLPAKTRAFIDLVVEAFKRDRLAERFAGSLG